MVAHVLIQIRLLIGHALVKMDIVMVHVAHLLVPQSHAIMVEHAPIQLRLLIGHALVLMDLVGVPVIHHLVIPIHVKVVALAQTLLVETTFHARA